MAAPKTPDELARETQARLVNIERKVDWLLRRDVQMTPSQAAVSTNPTGRQMFGDRTFAQHGDDFIAMHLFRSIGIDRPTYLDIGAHDPFKISNTALLYGMGCHGINVEANPNLIGAFRVQRPRDINLNVGVADSAGTMTFYMFDATSGINTFDPARAKAIEAEGKFKVVRTQEIPVVTIGEIVREHWNGQYPDYLSLDVEGLDLRVLKTIDFGGPLPKLICVEAVGREYIREIFDFLMGTGFRLMFRAHANLFFMPDHLAQKAMAV